MGLKNLIIFLIFYKDLELVWTQEQFLNCDLSLKTQIK